MKEEFTIEEARQLKELYGRFREVLHTYCMFAEDSEALDRTARLMEKHLPKEKEIN